MAVLKRYTAEHHSAISAARQELHDVVNNVGRDVPVAQATNKRKPKAKPKPDEGKDEE